MSRIRPRVVLALSLLGAAASGADDADARCLVTAPGECVQVTISGKGPDVVLIPGLFGSAFSFRRVTALLASEGYRTIVVEPLGVGDSARPKEADYTLTAQADPLVSFSQASVPGAGHVIFEEAPAAVAAAVREVVPAGAGRGCDKPGEIPGCPPPRNQPEPPHAQRW